ncbi:unnamed protein product, partial [Closterium sp. Naga37s-1]
MVAEQLGMEGEGGYISHPYIEDIKLHHLTQEIQSNQAPCLFPPPSPPTLPMPLNHPLTSASHPLSRLPSPPMRSRLVCAYQTTRRPSARPRVSPMCSHAPLSFPPSSSLPLSPSPSNPSSRPPFPPTPSRPVCAYQTTFCPSASAMGQQPECIHATPLSSHHLSHAHPSLPSTSRPPLSSNALKARLRISDDILPFSLSMGQQPRVHSRTPLSSHHTLPHAHPPSPPHQPSPLSSNALKARLRISDDILPFSPPVGPALLPSPTSSSAACCLLLLLVCRAATSSTR